MREEVQSPYIRLKVGVPYLVISSSIAFIRVGGTLSASIKTASFWSALFSMGLKLRQMREASQRVESYSGELTATLTVKEYPLPPWSAEKDCVAWSYILLIRSFPPGPFLL